MKTAYFGESRKNKYNIMDWISQPKAEPEKITRKKSL